MQLETHPSSCWEPPIVRADHVLDPKDHFRGLGALRPGEPIHGEFPASHSLGKSSFAQSFSVKSTYDLSIPHDRNPISHGHDFRKFMSDHDDC